jgi:hypothetical protein
MHQGGGLECVVRPLPPQMPPGDLTQLLVEDRHQIVPRPLPATPQLGEEIRDPGALGPGRIGGMGHFCSRRRFKK